MKKIIVILALALLLITAGLLHLAKTGISLRPESLIAPSVVETNLQDMAPAVMTRLLPQLEESHLIVFKFLPFTTESEKFFLQLRQAYEANLHRAVIVIDLTTAEGKEKVSSCKEACWVLSSSETKNSLKPELHSISVTWVPFALPVKVPMDCWSEKILDSQCFELISIQTNQKKIKPDKRYFFLNGYNETDYFLFVQNPK